MDCLCWWCCAWGFWHRHGNPGRRPAVLQKEGFVLLELRCSSSSEGGLVVLEPRQRPLPICTAIAPGQFVIVSTMEVQEVWCGWLERNRYVHAGVRTYTPPPTHSASTPPPHTQREINTHTEIKRETDRQRETKPQKHTETDRYLDFPHHPQPTTSKSVPKRPITFCCTAFFTPAAGVALPPDGLHRGPGLHLHCGAAVRATGAAPPARRPQPGPAIAIRAGHLCRFVLQVDVEAGWSFPGWSKSKRNTTILPLPYSLPIQRKIKRCFFESILKKKNLGS